MHNFGKPYQTAATIEQRLSMLSVLNVDVRAEESLPLGTTRLSPSSFNSLDANSLREQPKKKMATLIESLIKFEKRMQCQQEVPFSFVPFIFVPCP